MGQAPVCIGSANPPVTGASKSDAPTKGPQPRTKPPAQEEENDATAGQPQQRSTLYVNDLVTLAKVPDNEKKGRADVQLDETQSIHIS